MKQTWDFIELLLFNTKTHIIDNTSLRFFLYSFNISFLQEM